MLEHDIKKLRASPPPLKRIDVFTPAPWDADETITRHEYVPDELRAHRKVEILGAWDAWQAEIEGLKESMGLNAANSVVLAVSERANAIDKAILDYLPRTFAGLQAKAQWIASNPNRSGKAKQLLQDIAAMSSATLLPVEELRPVAVPVGLPAGHYPADVPRKVVESYRTFLDMELRFLNWETHRSPNAVGGIWLDNPAASMHGGDNPPPSSRAAAVLGLLNLLPNDAAATEAA